MDNRDSFEGSSPVPPATVVTTESEVLESDDDNAETDGFLSSVFGQVSESS